MMLVQNHLLHLAGQASQIITQKSDLCRLGVPKLDNFILFGGSDVMPHLASRIQGLVSSVGIDCIHRLQSIAEATDQSQVLAVSGLVLGVGVAVTMLEVSERIFMDRMNVSDAIYSLYEDVRVSLLADRIIDSEDKGEITELMLDLQEFDSRAFEGIHKVLCASLDDINEPASKYMVQESVYVFYRLLRNQRGSLSRSRELVVNDILREMIFSDSKYVRELALKEILNLEDAEYWVRVLYRDVKRFEGRLNHLLGVHEVHRIRQRCREFLASSSRQDNS